MLNGNYFYVYSKWEDHGDERKKMEQSELEGEVWEREDREMEQRMMEGKRKNRSNRREKKGKAGEIKIMR